MPFFGFTSIVDEEGVEPATGVGEIAADRAATKPKAKQKKAPERSPLPCMPLTKPHEEPAEKRKRKTPYRAPELIIILDDLADELKRKRVLQRCSRRIGISNPKSSFRVSGRMISHHRRWGNVVGLPTSRIICGKAGGIPPTRPGWQFQQNASSNRTKTPTSTRLWIFGDRHGQQHLSQSLLIHNTLISGIFFAVMYSHATTNARRIIDHTS